MKTESHEPFRRVVRAGMGIVSCLCLATPVRAGEALVAVATNFAEGMARLELEFEQHSEHRLTVATGSTGKLYAQIRNGAPFDVLLAADQERPRRLEASGLAVAGTRRTYAVGRLMLWSRDPARLTKGGSAALRDGSLRRLAVAHPELAPYGAAALETLAELGLLESLHPRLVRGENVGQAFALVATGAAELGFVAQSQLVASRAGMRGASWEVPARLHAPIRQDCVLLERASTNPAARAFLAYLEGPEAQATIREMGYRVESP